MYKLIISIVFVLAVLSQLFAQEYEYVPFPDSGAVWSEMYTSDETMVVYERFTLSGEDTIINDIYYKKLYIFYDKTFDKKKAKCIGGIREDENKRIYFKGDTVIHNDKPLWLAEPPLDEMLLYDFSLEIGDTIKNGNSHDEIVVMDIDTILFGNTLRKVFKLSHHVEWIEGIGNTRGLLYSSGDIAIGGSNGYLICFIQNDIVLYHNDYYDDCFPSTLNADIKQINPEILVCSNPLEQQIQFKWCNCIINRIEIFDVQGVLIDVINVSNDSTEVNYPTNRMQSGVYIYRANSSNGYSQTGRFVVE
ncbi:MAG: T9SS type A sorting domain-containing protein [Marinilabiliaceae bacterium]|nr:T9SS type A sorting domain-containing protein [Marinilabiliaceae bacterium]